MSDFEYGAVADIPTAIRNLVSKKGPGEVKFDPPDLSTIGKPRPYTIQVRVEAAPGFTASGPIPLSFQILKANPDLKLAPIADFDYGTVKDIPAMIEKAVSRKGQGEITYSLDSVIIDLASIDLPKHYEIEVNVKEDDCYRADGPKTIEFEIRKLPTTLTISPLANWEHKPQSKVNVAALIPPLVVHDGDGEPHYTPTLKSLKDEPGDYRIEIYVSEGQIHAKSKVEVLTFTIYQDRASRTKAFDEWVKNVNDTRITTQANGKKTKFPDYIGDPPNGSPTYQFATVQEMWDHLDGRFIPDVPSKDEVWNALGYPAFKSKANWKIEEKGTTSKGVKMHLTISYDNIRVPRTLADWKKSAAELYAYMFESVSIKNRVHMTLESAGTESGKVHLFAGGTNGEGNPWKPGDFEGQMKELMKELATFRNQIIAAIPGAKTTLGVE